MKHKPVPTRSFHFKMNKHNAPLFVPILAPCSAIVSHFLDMTLMTKFHYPKSRIISGLKITYVTQENLYI